MLPKRQWIAWCWSIAAVVACTEDVSTGSERPDNAALGIAEIQVSEAGERTTVVGLDAQGREVGRLELQYGRIVLGAEYGGLAGVMPIFSTKYPSSSRRLNPGYISATATSVPGSMRTPARCISCRSRSTPLYARGK